MSGDGVKVGVSVFVGVCVGVSDGVLVGVCVGKLQTLQSPNKVTIMNSPGACPGVETEHTKIVADGAIVGNGFKLQSIPIGVAVLIAEPFVI